VIALASAARIAIGTVFDPKGLKDAEKGLDDFTQKGSGKFKDFAGKAALAFAAVGAGAVIVGSKLIDAGEKASTSNARIGNIIESMGLFDEEMTGVAGSADEVTKRLIDMAEATARLTGVDQNSIKATQAKLGTFKEIAQTADQVGGNFDRATMAAIDLAAAGFGSAEGNAVQLGKALNDPIKGLASLSKSGVTFTDAEKERIQTLVEGNEVGTAQKLILEAIETQVGGTAAATANASDRMSVGFSQLQERLGQKLLPIFERFVGFMLDRVLPAIDKVVAVFGESGIGGVFALFRKTVSTEGPKIIDAITGFLGRAFDWIKDTGLPLLLNALQSLGEAIVDWVGPRIVPFLKAIVDFYVAGWTWIIQEGLPLLLEKLQVLGAAIVDWVGPRIVPFLTKLGEFIGAGAGWIFNVGLPMLAEKLADLAEQLVAWIGPQIPPALAALGEFMGKVTTWIIGTGVPLLVSKMFELGLEFWKWILPTIPKVLAKLLEWSGKIAVWILTEGIPAFLGYGLDIGKGMIDGIVEAIGKFASMLFNLGKDIVASIVDGITSAAGSIGSAILGAIPGGDMISGAIGAVGGFLGFKNGGLIPGPVNMPMPIMAHGGEYVLSADIVDAIRRGGPSRGLDPIGAPPMSQPMQSGPSVIIENYTSVERSDDEMLIGMLEFAVRGGRL
jgi:hypothetical protein